MFCSVYVASNSVLRRTDVQLCFGQGKEISQDYQGAFHKSCIRIHRLGCFICICIYIQFFTQTIAFTESPHHVMAFDRVGQRVLSHILLHTDTDKQPRRQANTHSTPPINQAWAGTGSRSSCIPWATEDLGQAQAGWKSTTNFLMPSR